MSFRPSGSTTAFKVVATKSKGKKPKRRNRTRTETESTLIWAHTGMGRVVRPVAHHAATIEAILKDPQFSHVYFDISWDEVAKYLLATSESIRISAQLINRYPDRLLFGTDEVAPPSQEKYLKVYQQYQPLWDRLDKETSEEVRKGNYEHIFDVGGKKVRAWEQVRVKP